MKSDPQRDLFVAEHAARTAERAGQKYRPSNGTEGGLFMERYCHQCRRDSEERPCEILTRAVWADIDDPEYPAEWQYSDSRQPMCTALEKQP